MTSISRFFTITFTVKRQEWATEDGNEKSTEKEVGTFNGQIQKQDRGFSQQLTGGFTKTYSIWCDIDTDVREGDSLIDEDSNTYSVKIVRKLKNGINKHIKITAEKDG